ncbi:MAG TPA: hypothetical protein VFP76_02800 [Gemmatimonadota bacterium]|nr:hypothetical protein [Gemmatimonadota bacterium]
MEDGGQEPDLEAAHREQVEGAAAGEGVGQGGIQVDPVTEEERHREGLERSAEADRHPIPQMTLQERQRRRPARTR